MRKIIKSNIQFVHILFCTLFILMLAVVSVSDTHAAVKIKETRLDCEDANYFSGGRLAVEKNGKWGFVDKKGAVVVPCIYDDASKLFYTNVALVCKDGKWGMCQ